MIVLQSIEGNSGHFQLQVGYKGMKIVLLRKTDDDIVFPVTRESAVTLVMGIEKMWHSLSQPSVLPIEFKLSHEGVELRFYLRFDYDKQFVTVDITVLSSIAREVTRFDYTIHFRTKELSSMKQQLELYWEIVHEPAIGDYLRDVLRTQWADSVLWGFPIAAVKELLANALEYPEEWEWSDGDTLVVANDGNKTWYAIHYHEGRFAWLTKTFE